MEALNVSGRTIGPSAPPYIIAEIGSNHNGDMALCKRMIDCAKECGADAVKFQSWSKRSLISKAEYARNTSYADKKRHFGSLEAMVERYQFTPEQHRETVAYCEQKGIHFLSSCFCPEEVDLLESLNVPAHKIASMDINHLPLLAYVAKTGKPVIVSTGMATIAEIERAVDTLKTNGAGPIALLHCIAIYPPPYEIINLRNMAMLADTFGLPVGFSDHTFGTAIPIAAAALGACIIEKHFAMNKSLDGWDHAISADPVELREICLQSRNVFTALGSATRTVTPLEIDKRKKFRRRLVAKRDLKAGEILTEKDFDFKRPGTGIGPDELRYCIGRRLKRSLEADAEIEWSHFE
jgi:N,N'-diacetyllegionaminate synthase